MHIVLAGGSGWLGTALQRGLIDAGHDLTILTRQAAPPPSNARRRHITWDGAQRGPWSELVAEADAVINLTGASIAGARWTAARKRELRDSRLLPTRALVTAIAQAERRPAVLINTSGVGYYGDGAETILDEASPPGHDFLATLCQDWETAARQAEPAGVRVVIPRVGIVIGPGGGMVQPLARLFRAYLGGHVGTGRQWLPWVSRADVVGMYRFALDNPEVHGPLNVVAPHPVRNAEFSRQLAQHLGRPCWLPAPTLALRIALGELADAILAGQNARPAAAERYGYQFLHPTLDQALDAALRAP